MDFQSDLITIIINLNKGFDENEIAFLALTSKIENPLRDRISFELQEKFADYIICRECRDDNHKKSDIAVFHKQDKKLKYLIEFKARSVQSYGAVSAKHMKNDLIKMSNATSDNSTQFYYIFFNNCIESEMIDDFSTKPVKYLSRIKNTITKSKNPIKENIENNWKKYLGMYNLPLEKYKRIDIDAGKYYGIPVSIITFVYGPFVRNELKHLR